MLLDMCLADCREHSLTARHQNVRGNECSYAGFTENYRNLALDSALTCQLSQCTILHNNADDPI